MTTEWKFPLLMMKMVVHSGRHLLLALGYRLRHCMPVKPLTESIPLILCQSTCRRLKKEAIFALKKALTIKRAVKTQYSVKSWKTFSITLQTFFKL